MPKLLYCLLLLLSTALGLNGADVIAIFEVEHQHRGTLAFNENYSIIVTSDNERIYAELRTEGNAKGPIKELSIEESNGLNEYILTCLKMPEAWNKEAKREGLNKDICEVTVRTFQSGEERISHFYHPFGLPYISPTILSPLKLKLEIEAISNQP